VKTCCLFHNLSHEWDSDGCEDSLIVAILLSGQIPHRQLHFKFRKKSSILLNSIPIWFYTANFITNGCQAATLKCPVWISSFKVMGCYSGRHFSCYVLVVGSATVARPNCSSCLVWNYSLKIMVWSTVLPASDTSVTILNVCPTDISKYLRFLTISTSDKKIFHTHTHTHTHTNTHTKL
jgi:hypothetical protein